MKSHFHKKGWASRLALRKRLKVIRRWPTLLFYLSIAKLVFIFKSISGSSQKRSASFSPESLVAITHEWKIVYSKTHLDGITHGQTIIRRPLFAGYVVGSRPMKRKKKCME